MLFEFIGRGLLTSKYLKEIEYNCQISMDEIGKNCWKIDTRRQRKKPGYQKHTETIRLISWDLDDANSWDTTFETKPIPPYPERWPDTVSWIQKFEEFHKCEVLTASYVKLLAHMPVYEHTDSAPFYHATERYHFVLKGDYKMKVGDNVYECREGDVFWFNGQVPHSVQNGDEERISLIFDVM